MTSDNTNGVSGIDQRVLLAQLTTDGTPSGQFYVQVFPNGQRPMASVKLVMLTLTPPRGHDGSVPSWIRLRRQLPQ